MYFSQVEAIAVSLQSAAVQVEAGPSLPKVGVTGARPHLTTPLLVRISTEDPEGTGVITTPLQAPLQTWEATSLANLVSRLLLLLSLFSLGAKVIYDPVLKMGLLVDFFVDNFLKG